MSKRQLEPGIVLEPVPVCLVTSVSKDGKPNVCTIAWAGVACSAPPMISLAIRPERYTNELIKSTSQFVVNIPSSGLAKACDVCGVHSGRQVDKLGLAGLTALPALKVRPPLIAECPINIECELRHTVHLGSHDLFVGEIVAVHADEGVLDQAGRLVTARVDPLAYVAPHEYWKLGTRVET